jgi:hypothetical protein
MLMDVEPRTGRVVARVRPHDVGARAEFEETEPMIGGRWAWGCVTGMEHQLELNVVRWTPFLQCAIQRVK